MAYKLILWKPMEESIASDEHYMMIIWLLLKIVLGFLFVIVLFATISVLIAYLYTRFKKHNPNFKFFDINHNSEAQAVLTLNIPFWMKPILGKLHLIIQYENKNDLPTIIDDVPIGKSIIDIPVPDIKEYKIVGVQFIFIDFMHLYKWYTTLDRETLFSKAPFSYGNTMIDVPLQIAKDENVHSEIPRPQAGEWLQYKPFEYGDDVRRILWKMYAKNKDLMVRQQELYNYYTSEATFLVSFKIPASIFDSLAPEVLQYLSNHYKNYIYQIVKNSIEQGHKISLYIDNNATIVNTLTEVSNELVSANFEKGSLDFEELPSGILITHSLINDEVMKDIEHLDSRKTKVVMIPLYNSLPKHQHLPIWKRILFFQRYDDNALLKHLPSNAVIDNWTLMEQHRIDSLSQ